MVITEGHIGKQVEVVNAVGRKYRFWVKKSSHADTLLECSRHSSRKGYPVDTYREIRIVKEKPDDVYDPGNRKARVDYAVRCIVCGRTRSRRFDTCFEMYDGAEVVHGILLRARKNSRLLKALEKDSEGRWLPYLIEKDRERFPDNPAFPAAN